MHSPEVLVFDLHIPLPATRWKVRGPRWQLSRRRYTCPKDESPLCGQPMHPWWQPGAWELRLAGRLIGWMHVADVWHHEPDDQDSGTLCTGMGGSDLTRHNVRWAWAHRAHIEVHWRHWRQAKRWLFLRCDHCGKPFRGRYRGVHGEMGGDEHWHTHCSSILHLERTNQVLAGYIVDGSDQWIARHWAEQIHERTRQGAS